MVLFLSCSYIQRGGVKPRVIFSMVLRAYLYITFVYRLINMQIYLRAILAPIHTHYTRWNVNFSV